MGRIYRFFTADLKEADLLRPEIVLSDGLEGEIFGQLTKVLRVKQGDVINISPGERCYLTVKYGYLKANSAISGAKSRHSVVQEADLHSQKPESACKTDNSPSEYLYEVVSANKKKVVLKFKSITENKNELGFGLTLVLCLPNKPDKLTFILQKAVELGVSGVVLVRGDFSQMKHELRVERLYKIMKEAAEQAERAFVPELAVEGRLIDFLGRIGEAAEKRCNQVKTANDQKKCCCERLDEEEGGNMIDWPVSLNNLLVALERDESPGLPAALKTMKGDISFLIGPEGGFSEAEKEFVRAYKLKTFTLGKRILRMETAAVVALGIIGNT